MTTPLVSQQVADVELAEEPLPEVSPKEAIEQLVGGPVEACSEFAGTTVSWPFHPLVGAIHTAFVDHRPLVLSPDMFWLLIAQGFAQPANKNADEYRTYFVKHPGQKPLSVRRDDFNKGSLENPWEEVFAEFSRQIVDEIGEDNHANMVVSFSTTGPIERAANEIVLMDTMRNYFSYEMFTLCGIPKVILEGNETDWRLLRDRFELLTDRYNLKWWKKRLLKTLDKIAANAAGEDNPELWQNIYKWEMVSGGESITGWITDFFPYLQADEDTRRNWLFKDSSAGGGGMHDRVESKHLPGSLSKVPFVWNYLGREYSMEFIAGFTSFTQDKMIIPSVQKLGGRFEI